MRHSISKKNVLNFDTDFFAYLLHQNDYRHSFSEITDLIQSTLFKLNFQSILVVILGIEFLRVSTVYINDFYFFSAIQNNIALTPHLNCNFIEAFLIFAYNHVFAIPTNTVLLKEFTLKFTIELFTFLLFCFCAIKTTVTTSWNLILIFSFFTFY